MDQRPAFHDILVIGASAGGLEVLRQLLAGLASDFPASVFIVVHIGATSHLAQILGRAGPLRVKQGESGERIVRGQVYVAAPGAHLLLHDDHLLLRRGPRENLARPAIDPLFRSAAATFGGRVIGVVLSGALNDGTAGLVAIKRCGGLAVAQEPADAAVQGMPRSAIRHADVDYIEASAGLAGLLTRLVGEPAGPTPEIPLDIRIEAAIAAQEREGMATEDKIGSLSPFSCPECHGTLWEIADEKVLRYRCHVGHAFTAEAMLATQGDEVEQMLWGLMRSHQERAALARRMAEEEMRQNRSTLAAELTQRATEYEEDAELVRRLFLERHEVEPATSEPSGVTPSDERAEV
jgi:two-component system chemotaxis response regulator CheB